MSSSSDAEYRRVRNAAVAITATEAALFLVGHPVTEANLKTLFHIRPGATKPKDLAAAELAFRQMAYECVVRPSDGIYRVSVPDDPLEPQFCLIHLGRWKGDITRAATFIRRCKDERAGHVILKAIQEQRIFN